MASALHYQTGEHHAARVLEANNLRELPICPFALAEAHDIVIQTRDAQDDGVTGFLMRVGERFGIYHSSRIQNDGLVRFTIAHELGHYFIPGHPEALFPDGNGTHVSRAGYQDRNRYEQEADGFASGLLMPPRHFRAAASELDPGFGAIESLAATCRTSITATAIRYAQYADDPVAVIMSTGDCIDYCFMSEAIGGLNGIRGIRKGTALPPRCQTRLFNAVRSNVASGRRAAGWTSLDDWFDGAPNVEMKEDVVGLGGYGRTLTVLFTEEVLAECEAESEDD